MTLGGALPCATVTQAIHWMPSADYDSTRLLVKYSIALHVCCVN